jgi:hypothetical protein
MSSNNDVAQHARPDESLVLYDTIITRIAGYRFHATSPPPAGAAVELVREPANIRDPNAIAVCDMDGQRLGYLFREIAEEHAALMDCGCVRLCGRMAAPGEPAYDHVRVQTNPVLYLWVFADETRLSEILSSSDAASPPSGALAESTAITEA